jgi:hypothetical protein
MTIGDEVYGRYKPLGFSPAEPGWRAMFGETDVSVEPLIGWGVYEVTIVDRETDEPSPLKRNVICGVFLNFVEQKAEPVLDGWDFVGYLRPEDPDPTPGEKPDPDKGKGRGPDKGRGRGRGRRP